MSHDSQSSADIREMVRWARTPINATEPVEVRHHVGSVTASEGGRTLSVDVVLVYEPNPMLGGPPLIRTGVYVELNGRRLTLEEAEKLRRTLLRAARMVRNHE
jgi:hypothetical protein